MTLGIFVFWLGIGLGAAAGWARQKRRSVLHVDRVGHDARPGSEVLLGRYRSADHPDIGGQERNGSATYVYISEPHTMADCPFDAEGNRK